MSTTVPQPQPQPQSQPLPEPEQPSSAQLDTDPNVLSAVRFLQDPRVKSSQVESQIRFLKGKNMSDAQIKHAFTKVGRAVTAEKIASVRAPAPMSASSFAGQPSQSTANAMSLPNKSRPPSPMAAAPQPHYSQTLFPRAPPPPQEEVQAKGVDWRDVVIGTGAAMLAGIAGYKLFNRYSPYEIRRKSEKKPARGLRGSYAGRQRGGLNASSESEADGSGYPPQLRHPPLPPPPTGTPPAVQPAAAALAAAPGADAEELKKLQAQLDETKEALTNERKKCADLAVGSAKIRAEKQQLSRANDRLTQQIDALKKDVEKLEEEKAAASGEGKLTATEEEPPRPFYPSLTVEAEQARASAVASPVTSALSNTAAAAPPTTPSPVMSPVMGLTQTAVAPGAVASVLPATPPAATPSPASLPTVDAAAAAAAPTSVVESPPLPPPTTMESAAPATLASVVPPAFLTPEPIKPEEAAAAAPTN